MKIINMDIFGYSAPYRQPYSNSLYTYSSTDIVVCRLKTDNGLEGFGWTHGKDVVIKTMQNLRDIIIGADPFCYERIWQNMYKPKLFGRKGFETRAISAVDIALWDLMGKKAGVSVHKLLGGYSDSIPAYIAGGYYENDKYFEQLRFEMKENLKKGAKAVKMKIGGASIPVDIERIDAVRDAVGPECKILVDANNAYNRIDALKMGRELDKRDIYWFEEPLSPDDLDGCSMLSSKLDTPIAIGENEYTKWGFKQILDCHAASILNADAQVLGGITEWRKIADMAQAYHVLLAPHGDQEIHMHLVGAMSNGLIAEYYDSNLNALLAPMFSEHMVLNENGMIDIPNRPGLGVEINFDALKPFEIFIG